jgi:hypothetical protein
MLAISTFLGGLTLGCLLLHFQPSPQGSYSSASHLVVGVEDDLVSNLLICRL